MQNPDTPQQRSIFCHNFAWLRRSHGLTQAQMAQLLHISVGYVRRIEHGDVPAKLGVEIVLSLVDLFHIDPRELFIHRMGPPLQGG